VRPNPPEDRPDATIIDTSDGGCGSAPTGDYCGQTFLRELDRPPNLYFVIDRSGSMGEPFEETITNKYRAARSAITNVLQSIGHRIRYGAAIFPSNSAPDACSPGQQVFPTVRGDPVECAIQGIRGPILDDFVGRLSAVTPTGATPTAATLESLLPMLSALEGDTYVVLVTDGAPNCNLEGGCSAAECTLNIEMVSVDGRVCDETYNCCDPENTAAGFGAYCTDGAASERAVSALADAGIMTYVIGLPGAEAYAALLDRLAVAGGTARGGDSDYYSVADADALEQALLDIGTGIAISCSIDLESPPEDPARVNVYFDGTVVPGDESDGWVWDGERRIEVRGAACDELRSGEIREARVVFGCDTVVR
jgi:hypothetical protein